MNIRGQGVENNCSKSRFLVGGALKTKIVGTKFKNVGTQWMSQITFFGWGCFWGCFRVLLKTLKCSVQNLKTSVHNGCPKSLVFVGKAFWDALGGCF